MIRHLVAVRYRDGTPDSVKSALMDDLAALRSRIDGIVDFQVRANISVENAMVRGFRDLFWFDFCDEAVRDAYLADAEHQAIGARLVAELDGGADGVFVCDFAL
jgi:hypothetical protein